MKTIECFYATRSIDAHFGAERIVALARQSGRRLVHRPIDPSEVIPAAGGLPFDRSSAARKANHFGREIERWSEFLGIPALVYDQDRLMMVERALRTPFGPPGAPPRW
jgi:2-hydroxychromene-2-carboxylate isomerase